MREPCPVEGCTHSSSNVETLFGHLYTGHPKHVLIATLIRLVKRRHT